MNERVPTLLHANDVTVEFRREFKNSIGRVRVWKVVFQGVPFLVTEFLPEKAPANARWLAGPIFSAQRAEKLWEFKLDPHVIEYGSANLNVFFGNIGKGVTGLLYEDRLTRRVFKRRSLESIV